MGITRREVGFLSCSGPLLQVLSAALLPLTSRSRRELLFKQARQGTWIIPLLCHRKYYSMTDPSRHRCTVAPSHATSMDMCMDMCMVRMMCMMCMMCLFHARNYSRSSLQTTTNSRLLRTNRLLHFARCLW